MNILFTDFCVSLHIISYLFTLRVMIMMLISLTYMEMSEENIRAVHVAGGLSPDHIISPSCSSVQDFFFNINYDN